MPRGLETCVTCARLFSVLVDGKCGDCAARLIPATKAEARLRKKQAAARTVVTCIRCRKTKPGTDFITVPKQTSYGTCRECVRAKSLVQGGRPKQRDPDDPEHFCRGCKEILPRDRFLIDRRGYVEGSCRECRNARSRERRKIYSGI